MERRRIIILFLVIHFAELIISYDDEGTSELYKKRLPEHKKQLLQLNKKENELFDRLTHYYENFSAIILNDDTVSDILYFWYILFWVSVNLKVCSLVHQSELITQPSSSNTESKNAEHYDSVFRITSKIFQNLKMDIRNYYSIMQNKEMICGPTSSDSDDTDAAESIWEELMKLNLNFVMSMDASKEIDVDEYEDGLVKWSKINNTKGKYKTLFPKNNSPDNIEILKLSKDNRKIIKNAKKADNTHSLAQRVLHTTWCLEVLNFINIAVNEKILNCFFTRLIGSSLTYKKYVHSFMFYDCPDTQNVVQYIREFNEDQVMTIAINMVRLLREQWTTYWISSDTEDRK